MTITKTIESDALTLALSGRLDTTTSPELEDEINASLAGIHKLPLDFTELSYISSAGLRVLLAAQKKMNVQGEMRVVGVNDTIMEIFEVTGFSEILTIE